jgi:hypothetical protein
MKRLLTAAVITVLMGPGSAFVQTAAPSANPNATTPAVASAKANNPGAPAAGANSFTKAQGKSRIEGAAIPTFPVYERQRWNLEG